ncbi:MAG: M14 family metallopeptidase [Actinomycetota bacterium]
MTDSRALALAADYESARADFRAAAETAGADQRSFEHPSAVGRAGEQLALDVATLGPGDAEHRVLVVSGTHGVEGYCGSAMQTNWLRHLASVRPTDVRLVMVHALNPYGFSWVRRVNEDNIDLNRNFVDFDAELPDNDGYASIADDLVPASWDEATQGETLTRLLGHVEAVGMGEMQHTVSSGQYTHPLGVFYGGTGPSWSRNTLEAVWASEMAGAATASVLDLHTGLGPWAHGELISHEHAGSPGYVRATERWGEVHSMRDGESVSASLSGDWLGAIESWAGDTMVDAVAIEYGTVDTITVLMSLRADAWLHGHGDPTATEAAAIRRQVWTAFLDDDPAWIATCNEQFERRLAAALIPG